MFYLEINGIAASSLMSRNRAIAQAAAGHKQRSDAIVWLMRHDRATGRSVEVERLY